MNQSPVKHETVQGEPKPIIPEIKKSQQSDHYDQQPETQPATPEKEITHFPNEIYEEDLPPDTRVVGN